MMNVERPPAYTLPGAPGYENLTEQQRNHYANLWQLYYRHNPRALRRLDAVNGGRKHTKGKKHTKGRKHTKSRKHAKSRKHTKGRKHTKSRKHH